MQIRKRAPITRSALLDRLFGFSKRNCTRRMNNSENTKREWSKKMYKGERKIYIYIYIYISFSTFLYIYMFVCMYIYKSTAKRRETDAAATARLNRFRVSLAICKWATKSDNPPLTSTNFQIPFPCLRKVPLVYMPPGIWGTIDTVHMYAYIAYIHI